MIYNNEDKMVFETRQDAIEWLEARDWFLWGRGYWKNHGEFRGECEYLHSPGQYAASTAKPQKYKDGWGIRVEHFYYPNTFYVPKTGRI